MNAKKVIIFSPIVHPNFKQNSSASSFRRSFSVEKLKRPVTPTHRNNAKTCMERTEVPCKKIGDEFWDYTNSEVQTVRCNWKEPSLSESTSWNLHRGSCRTLRWTHTACNSNGNQQSRRELPRCKLVFCQQNLAPRSWQCKRIFRSDLSPSPSSLSYCQCNTSTSHRQSCDSKFCKTLQRNEKKW